MRSSPFYAEYEHNLVPANNLIENPVGAGTPAPNVFFSFDLLNIPEKRVHRKKLNNIQNGQSITLRKAPQRL